MEDYDGSIKINADMDSKGFMRGSERMQNAVESAKRKFQQLGQSINKHLADIFDAVQRSGQDIDQASQQAGESTAGAAQAQRELGQSAKETSVATSAATASLKEYDRQLSALEKKMLLSQNTLNGYQQAMRALHESTDNKLQQTEDPDKVAKIVEKEAAVRVGASSQGAGGTGRAAGGSCRRGYRGRGRVDAVPG